MKKILTLVVIVLTTVLYSCGGDDDYVPSFSGTWKLEEEFVNSSPLELNDCQKQTTYTFTDKTLKITSIDKKANSSECQEIGVENLTYTISDNNMIFIVKDGKSTKYQFGIRDNVLTLILQGTEYPTFRKFRKQ